MITAALKSVFSVKASAELTALEQKFELHNPELLDKMREEIRKHAALQVDALHRKYPDPRARIVYRLLKAREERLMAILLDNRLLEESSYVGQQ